MTQPPTSSTLGIDDAYLYGAWIEDLRLDGWDLLLAVRYTDEVSEFFELQPRLNVLACTIVFQTVRNRAEVEAFRRRWETSAEEWSLASVSGGPPGGYALVTREGGEVMVDCEACLLEDVELVAGDAVAWPPPHNAELFPDARRYLGGEPITLFDDPPLDRHESGVAQRSNASGYVLLALGLLGLIFVGTTVLREPSFLRLVMAPMVVFWTAASTGSLVAGVWLLRRGPPQL